MNRYLRVKRVFDVVGVIATTPLLAPIFMIVLMVHLIFVKGSVFFLQERLGKAGRIFTLYKFRTMVNGNDISLWTMFLRRSHLDELPQLLNILKGEMSFVGPRPLLKEYYPYFTKNELIRFKVLPGLTGLSQVNGGNLLSWDLRLDLDRRYVERFGFITDLKILIKTISAIARWDATASVSLIEERGK